MEVLRHGNDPFAQLLGSGRGKLPVDTVISARPTAAAHEDLDSYLEQLRDGSFERTLGLLSRQHQLIDERPLMNRLALEFCRHLVAHSAVRFDDAVRSMLDETGVYLRQSDHLAVSYQPRRQGKPAERILHIWPDGHLVGPLNCMSGPLPTACGLAVTAHWQRANRGSWRNVEAARQLKWKRCETCDERCPQQLDWVKEESASYIPLGADLYRKVLATVRRRAMKAVAERSVSSLADAQTLCDRLYRSALLPAAVAYATASGAAGLQRVLEARSWTSVTRAIGQRAPDTLLSTDDWKQALAPCVPQVDAHGDVSVDTARCRTARATLQSLAREHAGLDRRI